MKSLFIVISTVVILLTATTQVIFARENSSSKTKSLKQQSEMIKVNLAHNSTLRQNNREIEELYKLYESFEDDKPYYYAIKEGKGDNKNQAENIAIANAMAQITSKIKGAIGMGSTYRKIGSKDVLEYIQIDYIQQLLNLVIVKNEEYVELLDGSIVAVVGIELAMTESEVEAGMKQKIESTFSSLMSGEPTAGLLVTRSYGARGMWRSALVPGWGQFYKKSPIKGSLILAGIASTAIAANYANNKSNEYKDLISNTYDVDSIRSYVNKSNDYATVRNVCIGAAAAIYIYNIIDAIAAPGEKRVIVKKGASKTLSYGIAPTVMNNGAVGVSGGLKF